MGIVNTRTGKEVSSLWLVPVVPVFLVGLFFYAVAAVTFVIPILALLDVFPAGYVGPDPVSSDRAFAYFVLQFDHWLVGFAGFSNPWLAVVPGIVVGAIWEWATTP